MIRLVCNAQVHSGYPLRTHLGVSVKARAPNLRRRNVVDRGFVDTGGSIRFAIKCLDPDVAYRVPNEPPSRNHAQAEAPDLIGLHSPDYLDVLQESMIDLDVGGFTSAAAIRNGHWAVEIEVLDPLVIVVQSAEGDLVPICESQDARPLPHHLLRNPVNEGNIMRGVQSRFGISEVETHFPFRVRLEAVSHVREAAPPAPYARATFGISGRPFRKRRHCAEAFIVHPNIGALAPIRCQGVLEPENR